MPNFSIINNANEAHAAGNWSESATFNHKDKTVDSRGNYVSETYAGTKYRLISKQERDFSCIERGARGFVGVAAVICSLGLALFFTAVMELFTRQKEIIRFGVLVSPPTPLTNQEGLSTTSNPSPIITTHVIDPIVSPQDAPLSAMSSSPPEEGEEVLPWAEICLMHSGQEEISLEEFKDKLQLFNTRLDAANHYAIKGPKRIARELFKIAPKNLELEEIVNLVFEASPGHKISRILNAILATQPSFALSPYDEIRRTIASDEGHSITHGLFIAMLEAQGLDTDEDKVTACYDLAYRINHPYIYRLSATPILTTDYTLNFLSLRLNPQDRNQDVAEDIFEDEEQHTVNFPEQLAKWADKHPAAQINLWYDSALVTHQARHKTVEMIQAISQSKGVTLQLKDVRQLPNISDKIALSLHPGAPRYYRKGILNALILNHMISSSEENGKYCVVSDIDVEPMSPQEMFDQRTVNYLSSDGYVLTRGPYPDHYEVNLLIFNKEKQGLRETHYNSIIKKTESAIKRNHKQSKSCASHTGDTLDSSFVEKLYSRFREAMNEPEEELLAPRKVVKCPDNPLDTTFPKSDSRAEILCFDGDVVCTRYGRNNQAQSVAPIQALANWTAEPLDALAD